MIDAAAATNREGLSTLAPPAGRIVDFTASFIDKWDRHVFSATLTLTHTVCTVGAVPTVKFCFTSFHARSDVF